ncbi:hypothetical protein [Undibacterium terreum]|uniref:Uncharacterized protein n=1 Tax=Undibacterium terreum TaxID=1224302 RepID=A0A916XD18_9BURK|nr:hypothetical protein [Undibacterium terreum]GGC64651.1 hypothetical protein GCM10011396_09570 [Undibacterium terreum]
MKKFPSAPAFNSTSSRFAILTLIQLVLIAWIFRANWGNGFSFLQGDRYDNLIEISILEHWYNVLRGMANWATTNYFYPYPKTLGYNDGYLLYGIIYSVCRSLHADPFMASLLVNMTMKVAAFFCFFLFARKVLQLGFWYAVLGAVLFEISNNVVLHNLHAQLLTVAFAPLCATLLYFACKALLQNQSGRLLAYGSTFSVVYGLWAITSYYMLWFFSFFSLLVLLELALVHHRYLFRQLAALQIKTLVSALCALLVLALALLPFLVVYLPKAAETGMHSYASAMSYLLTPFDILNIGDQNYLYGSLMPALHQSIGFPNQFSENQMGMPPFLLLVFLCGGALAWRRHNSQQAQQTQQAQLILPMALAALALWALALVCAEQSAWYWIYHYFPGAKAVRVVARCMIFLVFPVVCVAMYFLSTFKHRLAVLLILPCCVLLIAEELNKKAADYLDRAASLKMLESVPPIPAGCRAFFVQDKRPQDPNESPVEHELYRHNVEAMVISEYINLPTINGFSSFNPPDWNFSAADRDDYSARVETYRAAHQIKGLCALDLQTHRWSAAAQ